MSAALARFLPDFEISRSRPAIREEAPRPRPEPAPAATIDIDAIREEARAEGRAEAEAQSAADHSLAIADLEARHQSELAALRTELSALAANAVPAAVAGRADDIAQALAADVAGVLRPLLDEKLAARMISALADEIREACLIDAQTAIAVSGPAPMLAALRTLLGDACPDIMLTQADTPDLVATMDQSRWSTRLDGWAASLGEALA